MLELIAGIFKFMALSNLKDVNGDLTAATRGGGFMTLWFQEATAKVKSREQINGETKVKVTDLI